MATTTAKAFDDFADRIALTKGQTQNVNDRRNIVAGYVRDAFPSSSELPVDTTTLMGSTSRDTAVRPLDDIDVLTVFQNKEDIFEKYRYDSRAFLYRIRNALDAKTQVKQVGARGQAVRLFYKVGLNVDIAPVFKWSSSGYALPAGDGSWLTTDPPKQKTWIDQRHRELNYKLKRRVRYLKRWNSSHSSRLQSWHLEVMVARVFTSISNNSRNGLMRFFEWAPGYIGVQDPDGHGGDLSTYITWMTRQAVLQSFSTAHERSVRAIQAEDQGNHKEAIRLWRIILGNEFPAYTGT